MDKKKALLSGVALMALAGCAAQHPKARVTTEIPVDCITGMAIAANTHCYGPDATHIKCDNIQITRRAGCEKLVVHGK
jgi:hypothetical protein